MFLPGSDISPLEARKREFYDGLTRWKSDLRGDAGGESPMLSVEGPTYEDALVKANNLMLANLWGDGLPLWPATRERVDWILRGTALPRTHVLGKFPPRGGVTTVETCAIALAMAGGRPEYLPVLVAAVEAFLDPAVRQRAVAGGIRQRVSGRHRQRADREADPPQFGLRLPRPGPAASGRARASGARCGSCSRTSAARCRASARWRTTAACATPTWCSPRTRTSCPRAGCRTAPSGTASRRARNSVSLVFANGATNIRRRGAKKETPEEDALQGMYRMADFMRVPNLAGLAGYEKGTPGIMMIPGVVAQTMAGLGWTKQSMREFLWENSRIPAEHLRRAGGHAWIEIDASSRDARQHRPRPVADHR